MSFKIDSRLPDVGTTIFTVISQLAQEHKAINLGQGFPDYAGPELLHERLEHYARGQQHQYPPMTGIPALRRLVAEKAAHFYDYAADPEHEVTIVPGATEGLFCAIQACVKPGDEVIVFDPAYDSYVPAITLAGAQSVHIPLHAPDFQIDWQKVKDAISVKTSMIIINTPHNPTGMVMSEYDMQVLQELVRETRIVVLSDEVYEHLVFDGLEHQSVLRYPELAERAIMVSSFGKTFHVTGWKTGYCIAPTQLSEELRKVHQFVTFVGVTPIQLALADFMQACPEHAEQLPRFYQAKRDLFTGAMSDSKFKFTPAAGSFFQLMDYSEISDKDDLSMARWLTTEVGVAAIPISLFYDDPPESRMVRFCFAKQDETLLKAASVLSTL